MGGPGVSGVTRTSATAELVVPRSIPIARTGLVETGTCVEADVASAVKLTNSLLALGVPPTDPPVAEQPC